MSFHLSSLLFSYLPFHSSFVLPTPHPPFLIPPSLPPSLTLTIPPFYPPSLLPYDVPFYDPHIFLLLPPLIHLPHHYPLIHYPHHHLLTVISIILSYTILTIIFLPPSQSSPTACMNTCQIGSKVIISSGASMGTRDAMLVWAHYMTAVRTYVHVC